MASGKRYDTKPGARAGESRNGHFNDGVHQVTVAAAAQRTVHNGMNDHRDIGRFGNDEVGPYDNSMGGGDHRGYDPGAWEDRSDD